MDSESASFQSGLTSPGLPAIPPRCPAPMPVGQIVTWTPRRLLSAFGSWLMEETTYPRQLSTPVTAQNRRA